MTKENPSYYSILTADVRYDPRLKPNEKILYSEITCLTNKNGVCTAGNKYFSDLYKVTPETISRWVSKLKKLGYLDVSITYKEGTKQIIKRNITLLTKKSIGIDKNVKTPIDKIVKDNNTSNNNTSSSIEGNPKKRFSKPTAEQINDYLKQTNNDNLIDADAFIDYYQAKDWMIGSNRMKDWKAAVRTWTRRETKTSTQTKSKTNIKSEIFDRISKGYDGTHQWKSEQAKKVFEQMRSKSSGVPWTGNEWQINQAISEAL